MNFDRNTIIGFVVLAVLFFGFFYFNSQEQSRLAKARAVTDSIANAQKPKPVVDTATQNKIAAKNDSLANVTSAGHFQQ